MTATTSAIDTRRNRCDTISTARSRPSRSIASRMRISLAASRCEVASSRTTRRAPARNARARAIRWRWPPLSRVAILADGGLVATRQGVDEACRRPPRGRPHGARRPRRPGGRAGCCPRHCRGKGRAAAGPRRRAPAMPHGRSTASGTPPTRIEPPSGSRKRRRRFASGRLAGTGRPDEGDDPVLRDDQVEPIEGGSRPSRVRDGHAGEGDVGARPGPRCPGRRPARPPWRRRRPSRGRPPCRRPAPGTGSSRTAKTLSATVRPAAPE